MKNSTPLRREHDFQGSGGSGNTVFLLFFGVRFLDGFGNGILMIIRWIWGPVWLDFGSISTGISKLLTRILR